MAETECSKISAEECKREKIECLQPKIATEGNTPADGILRNPQLSALHRIARETVNTILQKSNKVEILDFTRPTGNLGMKNRFSNLFHNKLTNITKIPLGPSINYTIDPPSSGEESECDMKDTLGPSIGDVCEQMFDANTFQQVNSMDEIPKEAGIALSCEPLPNNITALQLKTSIELFLHLKTGNCWFSSIKIAMKEGCKEGIVQFVEKNMACMFYHEVQSSQAIQGAYNIVGDILLNGFLTKKINVNWVYDKTQTNSHNWVAIVIRNLPPTVSSQIIQRNCSDEAIAKYALTPINIKGQFCSIVVADTIDGAQRICRKLNHFEIATGKRLKAHMHPRSNIKQEGVHSSLFPELFKAESIQAPILNPTPPKSPTKKKISATAIRVRGKPKGREGMKSKTDSKNRDIISALMALKKDLPRKLPQRNEGEPQSLLSLLCVPDPPLPLQNISTNDVSENKAENMDNKVEDVSGDIKSPNIPPSRDLPKNIGAPLEDVKGFPIPKIEGEISVISSIGLVGGEIIEGCAGGRSDIGGYIIRENIKEDIGDIGYIGDTRDIGDTRGMSESNVEENMEICGEMEEGEIAEAEAEIEIEIEEEIKEHGGLEMLALENLMNLDHRHTHDHDDEDGENENRADGDIGIRDNGHPGQLPLPQNTKDIQYERSKGGERGYKGYGYRYKGYKGYKGKKDEDHHRDNEHREDDKQKEEKDEHEFDHEDDCHHENYHPTPHSHQNHHHHHHHHHHSREGPRERRCTWNTQENIRSRSRELDKTPTTRRRRHPPYTSYRPLGTNSHTTTSTYYPHTNTK